MLEDKTLKQSTTISDLQERLRISEERNDELESSKTRELEKAKKLQNLELHSLRQENKNYMDSKLFFDNPKIIDSSGI